MTEILLPRIARRGAICPISIRGQAREARVEKSSSMRVSNRIIPPSETPVRVGAQDCTPETNIRNHRGLPVASSNGPGTRMFRPNGISDPTGFHGCSDPTEFQLSVAVPERLSLVQWIVTGMFLWTFGGVFQRMLMCVRSGV